MTRLLRDPRALVLAAFVAACLVGIGWGLPGTDSWAADSISPRSCGLGAIALTYTPGRFHIYPPLHMLVLTVLSLPWIGLAVARVGTSEQALATELIKPLTMTAIEVSARIVAVTMAAFIVWNTMRLWTRIGSARIGVLAGAIAGANGVLVYYAHTGNLEVPYLFWVTWALVEIDRVASGEPRETRALLLATAAVLTKDQAAAPFLLALPVYLVIVPFLRGAVAGEPLLTRKRVVARLVPLARASAIAIAAFVVVSGMLVNPSGYRARLALLFGPASKSWTTYPPGLGGALAIGADALRAVPHFTSWPIAIAAGVGLALALVRVGGRGARARRLLPFVAAASFTLFFTLSARRTEDRFLLPQSVLFFPYAAVALDCGWTFAVKATTRARRLLAPLSAACAIAAFALAALGVASMDATLLVDSRYEAERFLAALPDRTAIDVYGGSPFMPRIPPNVVATRPGLEPIADRRGIAGVTELVDPSMDPRPRAPAVIVLATELSSEALAASAGRALPSRFGADAYRDDASRRLFRDLRAGSLGYARVLRATCALPAPLTCRAIHDSTATESWIYGLNDVHSPTSGAVAPTNGPADDAFASPPTPSEIRGKKP